MVPLYWKGEATSIRAGRADGDIFELGGARYRAVMVHRWGAFTEIGAIQQD